MALQPITPTRRSERFQPTIFHASLNQNDRTKHLWQGQPVATRPPTAEDLVGDDRIDEAEKAETRLYEALARATRTEVKRARKAMMKNETTIFSLGDTILVSPEAANKLPGIAVITSMWEVQGSSDGVHCEEPMKIRIHWFLRPRQMATIRAHKSYLPNEIYYTLNATTVISPHAILGHCFVGLGADAASSSKSSKLNNDIASQDQNTKEFICDLAVDSRRGLFFQLNWTKHRRTALEAISDGTGRPWRIEVEPSHKQNRKTDSTKLPRTSKRAIVALDYDAFENEESDDSGDGEEYDVSPAEDETEIDDENGSEVSIIVSLTTPKRKRRAQTHTASSPKKRQRIATGAPTPHSKAALRQRAKRLKAAVVRPIPELAYEFNANDLDESLPKDPWLRAMRVLHVGSRPGALPCRESEFNNTLQAVETLLEEGNSGCIYISGVPGTGKTATVHAMVRQLKQMAERNEINPFTYVEINGLKIPEPNAAYGLLWEAISGHDAVSDGHLRISAKEALKQLNTHFTKGVQTGPEGHACVVLMDELDQLMTTKQDVIYNFFNWPTLDSSKLIVIAVANTHDLPERVMSGRVRSRLGMVRTNFSPYTFSQLEEIVNARLRTGSTENGGAKEITAPISADGIRFAAKKVASISGDARRVLDICRRAVELVQPASRTATTSDVQIVIKRMQNSPTASFLQNCSLHERVMLAALLKCIRRDGTEDVKLADHQHLLYVNILVGETDSSRQPTMTELGIVLDSLLASHAMLIEEGSITAKKAPGDRRVLLNVESTEVQRVLGDMGGPRWKNVLTV